MREAVAVTVEAKFPLIDFIHVLVWFELLWMQLWQTLVRKWKVLPHAHLVAGFSIPDELPELNEVDRHHAENKLVRQLYAGEVEFIHSLLDEFS